MSKYVCPSCGAEIRSGQKFCTNCGKRFTKVVNNDDENVSPAALSKNLIDQSFLSPEERAKIEKEKRIARRKNIAEKTGYFMLVIDIFLMLGALYNIVFGFLAAIRHPIVTGEANEMTYTLGLLSMLFALVVLVLLLISVIKRKHYKLVTAFTLISMPLIVVGGHFLFFPLSIFTGIIVTFLFLIVLPFAVLNVKANNDLKRE